VDRDKIREFLVSGVIMMNSDETRQILRDPAVARPGVHLIEMQRQGWDSLGVDRDVGCSNLDQVDTLYPGDAELLAKRIEFIQAAQRTYLRALEDRKPPAVDASTPLSRELMIEFFDACNTKMDMESTHKILAKHLEETKQMPNQLIIDMQRELLEVLGVEKEHGCACLSRYQQDFPDDQELHQRFNMWHHKARNTCMMVVKMHQMTGKDMPAGAWGENPELQRLQEDAKAAIAVMTPQERSDLLTKMAKKVQVFMNLPPDGRQSHMKKLADEDKLEFVKAQILLVNMMREQWAGQQATPGQDAGAPSQMTM